jgi:hypothetical protein
MADKTEGGKGDGGKSDDSPKKPVKFQNHKFQRMTKDDAKNVPKKPNA